MKAKKLLAVLSAVVMAVGMLSACSDSSSDSVEQENIFNSEEAEDTGFTWSNVTIGGGGYIPGVVYNESEEGLAYVKTDMGGAYRKKKGDDEWVPITDCFSTDYWNYTCIESIATDPIDTNRVYMSVGTSYGGNGAILYSYDYGDHWTVVEFDFTMGGNDWGRNCGERLLVDPNDNSRIYYASHADGLFLSEDYGKTWNNVESFPDVGYYREESYSYGILWITADKSSSDEGEATKRIFAGVAEKSGERVYVTEDAGETWTAVGNEYADDQKFTLYPCQGKVSADGNLYVTYANTITQELNPTRGMVCSYNIEDGTWKDITPETTGNTGQGYCGIAVYKDEMVAITTMCLWAYEDNIYVTKDGGETWTGFWSYDSSGVRSKDYTLDISYSPWLDWQGQLKLGWWTSGVAINPFNPDELLYGTGATLYGTDNLTKIGEEKINISVKSAGIEQNAVFDLYSPKNCGDDTPELYSTMGDLYGFRHDDVNVAPEEHWGAESFAADDLAVAANDPDIVVRTTSDSSFTNSICYSTDGSKTWQYVKSIPDGVDTHAGGNVELSADGKTLLYTPDKGTVSTFVTDDWGETWTEAQGLGGSATIVADAVNPDKIYASAGNYLYISKDKGKTFETMANLMLTNINLTVNKEVEGELWFSAASGPIYYIENADVGATPTLVTGDVELTYSISIGAPKEDGGEYAIYIYGEANGEGEGVYQSLDKGATWVKMNNSNQKWGNVNKDTLEADPKTYGRVYLSTNGRGIIMSDPE